MKLSEYADYDELIRATGLTIDASEAFGDYQGDYVYVVRDGERRGIAIVGYGSCSGCDALQASHGVQAEMEDIAWGIRRSVVWGDETELRAKLTGEQSRLSWYGSESGYRESVEKLLAPSPDAA